MGSAILRRRANRESINIEERERGEVVLGDVDPKGKVGIKQRERGDRKFKEG